jgi:hypothetical protein
MRRLSKKREVLEREYRRSLRDKLRTHEGGCEGCGMNVPVTPSHLVPRGYDISLLGDPENFHFHCQRCANLCELGEYPELLDGRTIYDYIQRVRPEYASIKELAYLNRHGKTYEEWLQ